MASDTTTPEFQLQQPNRQLRTALLCLPSWGAAIWVIILVILHEISRPLGDAFLKSKVVLYTVTFASILAPICWISAFISVFRHRPATTFQKIALAASAVAMLATWIVLAKYGHR